MPQYSKFRSGLHHIILIDEAIRKGVTGPRVGKLPNTSTLARELELSTRTIARNIEYMRDVLGAPIAYDPKRRCYCYSERNWSLPNIRITEGDLLGLVLAQMALGAYRGTPLESYLTRVADKLAASLPEAIDVRPAELEGIFRFSLGPVAPFEPKVWELLATAAREHRTVEMTYYVLSKDQVVDRCVDPYLLRCFSGNWYLVGHDHKSGHVPMFSLARIRRLRLTTRSFELRDDFDPDDYLSGTFHVVESKERHTVCIQFKGIAARLIEERVWHPSQKLNKKRDGSVVLEMTVAGIDEVGRWVLSWGGDARVLSPPELAGCVKQTALAISALYR